MKNITLAVEDDVLAAVRKLAAERETTVNGLVRDYLESLAKQASKDDAARARQRACQIERNDNRTVAWMTGNGTGKNSMTVPHFLDTNMLVYAAIERKGEEAKRIRAIELLQAGEFGVSAQVFAGVLHNGNKKFGLRLSLRKRRSSGWRSFVRIPCASDHTASS